MRLRNRKIFTALLLVFVLAFTPMPLFASVWENEGAALKSQLVELLGEMRAQWIISDIELDIEHGHLDDETLEKVLSMDILEYLAEHLTPRELEEFLAMESADRFFLLRMDVFLTISISGWGTFGGTSVVVSDIWDNEGRALMAQLTELMGVGLTYSFVNVVDLAYENSLGQFDSDALARLLEWDIMAWLEEHKTPEELAAFMAQDNDDRYSYLFGVLSNNFLFPRQVEPRDVIGEEEIPFFSDILTFRLFEILWTNLIEPLIQEVYEADSPPAPVLSPIWENEGQALLAQLAELLGEEAVWFADYMDWLLENDHLDLATYSEILTLNLRELLAQELTQQELADFFEMDYFDRYGILAQIVVLPHLEVTWLDWAADRPRFWEEEGLALKTQLTELLGEERAVWIIDYLDWWTWTGLITDDIKAEILALDVMAALREHLAAEELKEFFGMGYFNRAWVFRESIILPMISTIDVTRENIAAVLEIVAQEHIEEFDFDIIAMLNEAGMDTDDLVEMLYFMLTAYDGTIMWMGLEAGPDWLYHYIDTMLTTMQWSADEDMAMFRMLATVGRMYAILGDYADVFFEMPIFEDLFLVFDDRLGDAIILDPGFEETLAIYGTELLDILDFRLHDALSEHFADTQADMPRGLAVLDALLGGLLTQNMDELYHFYIYGEPMPVFALDRFWRFLSEWEYITLTYENLEERMSFDVDTGTEFAIDLFHGDDNSRLNLFFDNHADVYATFVIEFPGVLAWREYVLDVAPGGSATMQITADERGLPGGMVWVMIVNTEGGEVGGEFALRKTHHPLY